MLVELVGMMPGCSRAEEELVEGATGGLSGGSVVAKAKRARRRSEVLRCVWEEEEK